MGNSNLFLVAILSSFAYYALSQSLIPTPQQLAYQRQGIVALTHFNMATFFQNGDPGCTPSNFVGPNGSSNPASFNPTNLNISNWVESYQNLGVQSALLTAKHGCGFYLFPPQTVTLPNGSNYWYNVSEDMNVVKMFADTLTVNGIAHGYYYSLTNNFYLNAFDHQVRNSTLLPGQVAVTQEQYEAICLQSLEELWSTYGKFGEIWFDGGYGSLGTQVNALLQKYQPQALAMNGGTISNNSLRWSGCECDTPPGYPTVYSTICSATEYGPGCQPNSTNAFFAPSSTDYTLQANDIWFWVPNVPLRTLSELQATYHATIGANTVLELDFAIDRTGNVAPDHAILYKQFGDWIRQCYGTPLFTSSIPSGTPSLVIPFTSNPDSPVYVDRIVLQEDQSLYGQCVSGYSVEMRTSPTDPWFVFSQGLTIGGKRIDLQPLGYNITDVRLNISTSTFCPNNVRSYVNISYFDPNNCSVQNHTRVNYMAGNGLCLSVNSSGKFPCWGIECPIYLGNCSEPGALWDDYGNTLSSWQYGVDNTVINVDCNSCQSHSLVKLITGTGSGAILTLTDNQLTYTCTSNSSIVLCVNDGTGTPIPACGGDPPYGGQLQVVNCGDPGTNGWTRVVVNE